MLYLVVTEDARSENLALSLVDDVYALMSVGLSDVRKSEDTHKAISETDSRCRFDLLLSSTMNDIANKLFVEDRLLAAA